MHIEIDVFSGRPNPTFEIGAKESSELQRLLTGLPQVPTNPPEPGLGYRGFIIRFDRAEVPGMLSPIRVYGGYVVVEGDPNRPVYRDTKACEHWLKQKARDAGYGDLVG